MESGELKNLLFPLGLLQFQPTVLCFQPIWWPHALFGVQQNKSTTNQNNQNNNKTETGKERPERRVGGVHD